MHAIVLWIGVVLLQQPLSVTVGGVDLEWRAGTITGFHAGGRQWLKDPGVDLGAIVRAGAGDLALGPGTLATEGEWTVLSWPAAEGRDRGRLTLRVKAGGPNEIILEGDGDCPDGGLTGLRWGLASLPADWKILVPGNSGLAFDATGPTDWGGTWPMNWEVQFVVAQGPGHGLWVWAEDAANRFKSLRVQRRADGWRLLFTAENFAPWTEKKECELGRWHVAAFEGDWRVPARRYLDWARTNRDLRPLEEHGPAWVKNIRCVAICQPDTEFLEALARRVDASQTLLYVPNWRRDGYDRNYPDYTAIDGFGDFVEAAHRLGFRVMVHVNYFGCDPKNPEYARFEKYQVVDPYSGEKQWWVYPFPPEEPDIKFAYINPAAAEWRSLIVERFREVVTHYRVDALHLDQTLCIFNDRNGLIGGMSMIEGNLALHRALREALPDVALSGEGLNEVTCRYESFAQRHPFGLDAIKGTYSVPMLRLAHPISSYILLPQTKMYGYLGMAGPGAGQLYAAWREAYRPWGVLPTLGWVSTEELRRPTGWTALAVAEAAWFTQEAVEPDLDGPWPAGCIFPYRLGSGRRAWWRQDAGAVLETLDPRQEILRIIYGANRVRSTGSVPGWRAQVPGEIFGLDPSVWYPVLPEAPALKGLRITALSDGIVVRRASSGGDLAAIVFEPVPDVPYRLVELFEKAHCGWRGYGGGQLEVDGPLSDDESGAAFRPSDASTIFAHPPWKLEPELAPLPGLPGNSGVAWACFDLGVPDKPCRLKATVALAAGAALPGRSDGVVFRMRATAPGKDLRVEKLVAGETPEPLELDLSPLRGQKAQIWLEVEPNASPSYDWALWRDPHIEVVAQRQAEATVVDDEPWRLALTDGEVARPAGSEMTTKLVVPGGVFLLRVEPREVAPGVELWRLPFFVSFCDQFGMPLEAPRYACGVVADSTVGGATRPGLFAHPPDHGRTYVDFALRLPETPLCLRTWVGLRDGSRSEGCRFVVQVNGREVASRLLAPAAGWQEIVSDLSAWAGRAIVLSLVTDSEGSFSFDWAAWGEPRLELAQK